ncbi:hypothetical protein BJ138DRAFT_1107867 [Hygrophoropsis aurantiaca]|uniref:Uncharacterized protein n=1 Tax=Hygrophoropsis aurantiaca TaxID=72124 RepID=A0ACB7ZQ56_9AGAM|nr:hypothetical protein BJ138DRAFT_1107867 [Hygrophoropsis aurantiaca]
MGANQKISAPAKSTSGSSPAMSKLMRPPTSERGDESIASPEVELEQAHKKWEETQRSIPNARLASEYVMELLQQVVDEWRDRVGQSVPANYNHGINPYKREARRAECLAEALYETIDNVVWEEATTETEPEMTLERSEGVQGKIEDPHTSDEEPLDPRDEGNDYDRRVPMPVRSRDPLEEYLGLACPGFAPYLSGPDVPPTIIIDEGTTTSTDETRDSALVDSLADIMEETILPHLQEEVVATIGPAARRETIPGI